jgi:DNA-binding MarR family transcriptional regulator
MTQQEVSQMIIDQYLEESRRAEARWEGFDDELDDSVSLAFEVVRAARAFEHHLMLAAKDLTMTALQARFAWLLATEPGGVPVGRLWVELGMSQPGAHQMIQRMLARGLVELDISSWDTRNVVVRLTDLGLAQWAEVKHRLRDVCQELRDGVGEPQVPELRGNLQEIERVDERFPFFRSLRNPTWLLS